MLPSLLVCVSVLVALLSSSPVVAELHEFKTGFLGRTTVVNVHVLTQWHPQEDPHYTSTGGLTFSCEEGSGHVEMSLAMLSYRLKTTDDGPCRSSGVELQFDQDEPYLPQMWLRPDSALSAFGTYVTTEPPKGSRCQTILLRSPAQVLYHATAATYLRTTISEADYSNWGPVQIIEAPTMHFNLEAVRAELIELHNRCRKKR